MHHPLQERQVPKSSPIHQADRVILMWLIVIFYPWKKIGEMLPWRSRLSQTNRHSLSAQNLPSFFLETLQHHPCRWLQELIIGRVTKVVILHTLLQETLPGNTHHKKSQRWSNQESLFPSPIANSIWSTCPGSQLCPYTSSLYTPSRIKMDHPPHRNHEKTIAFQKRTAYN